MYKITCLVCAREGKGAFYWGESGHSPHWRGSFHLKGLENKSNKSVLYNHQEEHHPGLRMQKKDFRMTVESTFTRPILRQSCEGISLSNTIKARDLGAPFTVMNSKMEFLQPGVIRPSFAPLLTD